MIRDLIVEMSPVVIIILIVLLSIIKVSLISATVNRNYLSLFFTSFTIYNRVTVRNTFHEKLKEYYRRSNKVNTIFYVAIGFVVAIYLLMRAI